MPAPALLTVLAGTRRGRSLTGRLVQVTAVLVVGPPLLMLLVLSGVQAAPTTPDGTGLPDGGPGGPVPATLAASDAAQVAAVPPVLRSDFLAAARTYALPPALLAAVGKVESDFTPTAVGPPVPGGPAEGMMQFLPSSWTLFNKVPGASPFDPGPAVLAAARHLLSSGALPGGGFDAVQGLFGYNHSRPYGQHVLAIAASYGYRYDPTRPPDDPVRYHYPLDTPAAVPTSATADGATLTAPAGTDAVACIRAAVVAGGGGSVVLRGEDGFLYTYTGLASTTSNLRPGNVVEPGTPIGTTGGPLGFSIRHNSHTSPIAPAAYLAVWPHDPPAGPATTSSTAAATPGPAA